MDIEDGDRLNRDLVRDATALAEAANHDDFEEMRFRAHRLVIRARLAGYPMRGVANLSRQLTHLLGPPGTSPDSGPDAAVRRVSAELVIATVALRTIESSRAP